MFTYKTHIKLHQTDAAGVLFFGNQFFIIHDAYEAMLHKSGLSFAKFLKAKDYYIAIVHASCDYKAPLTVSELITVKVRIARVGSSSFTLEYEIYNPRKLLVGKGKTIHVSVDKRIRKKIPLPEDVRRDLAKLSKKP